jgi:hypothetical protein
MPMAVVRFMPTPPTAVSSSAHALMHRSRRSSYAFLHSERVSPLPLIPSNIIHYIHMQTVPPMVFLGLGMSTCMPCFRCHKHDDITSLSARVAHPRTVYQVQCGIPEQQYGILLRTRSNNPSPPGSTSNIAASRMRRQ